MSRIKNYEELILEKRKTENKIAEQKAAIQERIEDLKDKIEPVLSILSFFKKKKDSSGSNNSLLKVGASLAIDLLIGQKLLGKANWLTRLLVPLALKTVSAKVIDTTEHNRSAQLETQT